MKIGLYFGSFNPIHQGHLIIANHILNMGEVDKVWFVVSPQNPFKPSQTLLNEYHRLHLVQLAIQDDLRMTASDVEFHLGKPSYTINTLHFLQEKYPQQKFSIIMGSDSLQNLDKWHNARAIINHYSIIVYKRPGFPVKDVPGATLSIAEAPLLDISSTGIRKLLKEGLSARYMLPQVVLEEIMANGYYKK